MVVVQLDRAFEIDGLELHLVQLSPAHRGEHEYRSAVRHGRPESVEKSDILAVHEEVDVTPHLPALVHDSVERSRRLSAERGERVTDGLARLVEHQRRILVRVRAEHVWQLDSYQAAPAVPVFTHTMGGSASAISVHDAPSLLEP